MQISRTFCLTIALLWTIAEAAPVDNFVLLDEKGQAHELYYQTDVEALVLIGHSTTCTSPLFEAANQAAKTLSPDNIRVLYLNSDPRDARAALQNHATTANLTAPILDDSASLVGPALDLTTPGEAIILDTNTWEVTYRGRIDSQQARAALDQLTRGEYIADPVVQKVSSDGCSVPQPESQTVTYTEHVAPILMEKCAVCHTQGGIAPWAMTSYEVVNGFAPMIREVLRTKRMPPWHADPHVGEFIGDRSLSDEQLRTLVSWVEGGTHRGAGPDPLKENSEGAPIWPLGEPDLIVEVPAYDVPATGVVDYQFPVVDNPLDRPVWVKAATVVPGDRAVVHHVLMGASSPGEEVVQGRENVFENYIIGYAPGNESAEMPAGTGVYVEPGTQFLLQMHYTTYGKATTDRTRVGLYFHDEAPENYLRHTVVIDPTIRIPANHGAFEESAYYEFDKDAQIFSLVPHAHYRGKASKFEVLYPDGRKDLILSVPNYDFNWQRTYEFATPVNVPAGSRLVHTTTYDNSSRNPGNPNPDRVVPWGLQSWDEMLYGAVQFSWVDETSQEPIHNADLADTYQWVGFLDRDVDGKLAWDELPPRLKKRLVQGFKVADTNNDGGLDAIELYNLNRRQTAAAGR